MKWSEIMKKMELIHGEIELPAFFPDGTRGVVRTIDTNDLLKANVQGLVMNSYHLLVKPGTKLISNLGGLNEFINWDNPILTDSGGFQVFSLIGQNNKFGEIRRDKIIFRPSSESKKIILTPEKSIVSQFRYGSDIMMCLDYCTHVDDSYEINKLAVEITIDWAKRCKKEYLKLCSQKYKGSAKGPKIFGIIQGGNDKKLRERCAQELIDVGFDGFGYGGWPLDGNGDLLYDMLKFTADLMPNDKIKYAMGVGKPHEIVKCCQMGYTLFDCVIPTREARNKKLYIFNNESDLSSDDFYSYIYINDAKFVRDKGPISSKCSCYTCQNYSRAYLHHLFRINDPLAFRLATIHNITFYTKLMKLIRESGI